MKTDTETIKKDIVDELKKLAALQKKRLCFIQLNDDAATDQFVVLKVRLAKELGIEVEVIKELVTDTVEAIALLGTVIEKEYDGIVLQLPLPASLDAELLIDSIPTAMDIDMLSEDSKAHYRAADTLRTAPVAAAIQEILWHHKIILVDKKVVVVGRGRLVGEPVSMLLDRQEVPYTVIDIDTPEEQKIALLQAADVVISGSGAGHSITADMVKEGVVLIDAGTSEQSGKLIGDIDPSCYDKAKLYTPVPGGVGPLTVACLFRNLFSA